MSVRELGGEVATHSQRWISRLARAASCAALVVFTACPESPAPGEPNPGRILVQTSPSQRLAQGATAIYTVTVERRNFSGSVTLSVPTGSLPDGVTVEFDPQVLTGGETQSLARISASPTTPVQYLSDPQSTTIYIDATAPGGLKTTGLLSVKLVASSLAGVTVQTAPTQLRLPVGGAPAEALVTIQRQGNYSGPVSLSVEGGSTEFRGFVATTTPVAGVPDTWLLRVTQTDVAKIIENSVANETVDGVSLNAQGNGLPLVRQQFVVYFDRPFISPTISRALSLAAGQQDVLSIQMGRSPTMSGNVSLAVINPPSGVTVTFDQNPTANEVVGVTVAASNNVVPGDYSVVVRATPAASSLARDVDRVIQVTVLPRVTYTLSVPSLTLAAGVNTSGAFGVSRSGGATPFPVTVSFSTATGLALPNGMTITLDDNPVTSAGTTMRVSTAFTTPPGIYNLRAVGASPNLAAVVTPFTVIVTPVGTGSAVTRLLLDPQNAQITAPATQQYSVRLFDASGAVIVPVSGGAIEYSSSDPNVASINVSGVVNGFAAGPTIITARYMRNGTEIARSSTPLTVFAAGSAGHYGSTTMSVQGNVRTIRRGESMTFQIVVRNVAGGQVTSGVTPTVSSSNSGVISVVPTVGPNNTPGYFYDMTAAFAAPLGTDVRIRYDVTGAGGELVIRVVP